LTDSDYNAIKKRTLSRWGLAAVPLGILLGLVVGISFGNAIIGVAIGTALGFGAAVSLLAAVVVFCSTEIPE